jgi:hypothetical protein
MNSNTVSLSPQQVTAFAVAFAPLARRYCETHKADFEEFRAERARQRAELQREEVTQNGSNRDH